MEPRKQNVFECSAVTQWLEIELTNHCGMRCMVCPREELTNLWFLSFENFQQIVALLKQWSYSEVMVCWLGDAFIHPEINNFMEYLFTELPKIKLFFMTKGGALQDKHLIKIKELKERGYNVTLTFSVFSLQKKVYNYLTGGEFYDHFIEKLHQAHTLQINYTLEFMLSTLTLGELQSFKNFAQKLNKDYWISLVHNWSGKIGEKLHKKLFDENILQWYYIKREANEVCEVMKYDYLYVDCHGDVFQCSLNEIGREGYLWKLGEYSLWEFLEKKNQLDYKKMCENCFYFNYKTFN